jgi:hypothetical protein
MYLVKTFKSTKNCLEYEREFNRKVRKVLRKERQFISPKGANPQSFSSSEGTYYIVGLDFSPVYEKLEYVREFNREVRKVLRRERQFISPKEANPQSFSSSEGTYYIVGLDFSPVYEKLEYAREFNRKVRKVLRKESQFILPKTQIRKVFPVPKEHIIL